MTKHEIMKKYFEFDTTDLSNRLDKLMEDQRITSGARYMVYNPYSWYGMNRIQEMLDRAGKAKDYYRYISQHTKLHDWEYASEDIDREYDKAIAFVERQEALPFEETQKQVLIASGELKEV